MELYRPHLKGMTQMSGTYLGAIASWLRIVAANRVRPDQTGASLVEYALLLALIVVVAIGAVIIIGNVTSNSLTNAGNNFP